MHETDRWLPSPELRAWMGIAAIGLAIAACLDGASLVLMFVLDNPLESSLPRLLDASRLIPEFFVVVALCKLARETGSISLLRSGLGFYGSSWLLLALLMVDGGGSWSDLVLGITVAIGAAILGVLMVRDRSHEPGFDHLPSKGPGGDPQTRTVPPASENSGSGSGWGCGSALLVGGLLKVFSQGLQKANFRWFLVLGFVLAALFAVCWVLSAVWSGTTKFRLSERLGPLARICGVADILGLALHLALLSILLSILVPLGLEQRQPDFAEPRLMVPLILIELVWVGWAGVHVAWFISISQRIADPWSTPIPYRDRRFEGETD